MKMIQALFIPCSNAGVSFYRMNTWVNAAHRTKAGSFFMPFWDKAQTSNHPWEIDIVDAEFKQRILDELWDHAQKADVIIFQMLHTQPGLDLFLTVKEVFSDTPIITEQDDNMLSTPDYNPANNSYAPGSYFRTIATEQMKMSDALIVSTPYLQEVYSDFCGNIKVVPNSLDFRRWDNLKYRRNKGIIRIGWMGGSSHEGDLRIIEPVIHKILEKHKTVRFCFVHGIPAFLRGLERVETIEQFTRIDRYPQFLASRAFDIGLAPLVDNAFNRGKSNLRWLEFAGLKVPCVASKVGHFAETITQAEDGILCESEQDWIDSIEWLISDENARKRIGKNANTKARKQFNVDINVMNYAAILKEIASFGQIVREQSTMPAVEATA